MTELAMMVQAQNMRMKALQDLHSAACIVGDSTSAAIHAKAAMEAYGQILALQEEQYALLRSESGLKTEAVGRA